jgi:hypothetical protein
VARHTLLVHHIWAHERRKTKKMVDLGNVAQSDVDLLDLIETRLRTLEQAPLKSGDKFTRFDSHRRVGRSIEFTCSAGRYGADGEIVDIITGAIVGTLGRNHAPLAPIRNMIVVPAKGPSALLLTERFAQRGVFSVFADELELVFRERFDDLTLKIEALVEPRVWKEIFDNVQLESIAAVAYKKRDRGEKLKPQTVGVLRVERSGYRGSHLNRDLLEAAIDQSVPPHELVGLEHPLPHDDQPEVHVTVNDGEHTKTYVVGREKWPSVALVLQGDDDERPSNDEVFAFASEVAPSLLKRLDVDLPPDWRQPA